MEEDFQDLDNALDALVSNLDTQFQIHNQEFNYVQTDQFPIDAQNTNEEGFENGEENPFDFQDADSQLDEIVEEFEHGLNSNESSQIQTQQTPEQVTPQTTTLNASISEYKKPLPTPKPKPLPTPKPKTEVSNPQPAKSSSTPSKIPSKQPVKATQTASTPAKTVVRPPIKVAPQERKPVVPPMKGSAPQKTASPSQPAPQNPSPQSTIRNSSQDTTISSTSSQNASFNSDLSPRASTIKCSRCATASAVIRCDECESNFCLNCSEDLHIGKWKNHNHHAIEQNQWGVKTSVTVVKQRFVTS